jgi:hypothetical protein
MIALTAAMIRHSLIFTFLFPLASKKDFYLQSTFFPACP